MFNSSPVAKPESPEEFHRSHSSPPASADRLSVPLELGSVLFVEAPSELRSSRRLVLEIPGHPVLAVSGYHEVCKLPADNNCCLVVVDLQPNQQEALKVTKYARRAWPGARILLLGNPSEEFDDPLYDAAFTSAWNPQEIVESAKKLLHDLKVE